MFEAILEAFVDTLKIFVVVYLVYMLVEIFENKCSKKLAGKDKKWSPIFGAGFGLIPQCGFGVVATDLYSKKHITAGTLIAIYISTSDEALPILLSSPEKIGSIIPLLVIKFLVAIIAGYIIDGVLSRRASEVFNHADHCHEHEPVEHIGCCHHEIEAGEKSQHWSKTYLLHPLIHSLKICAYILIFNIIFGLIIHFVGEETIANFLEQSGAFAPVVAVILGLIPNCVGSVVVAELYVTAGLSFGATLGGLIANAGIAYVFLFKQNKNVKSNIFIVLTVTLIALAVGYIFHFLPWFNF